MVGLLGFVFVAEFLSSFYHGCLCMTARLWSLLTKHRPTHVIPLKPSDSSGRQPTTLSLSTGPRMIKLPSQGGFGAAGAPNDGIHQYFHQLRRCYMKVVVGQGNSVAMRRSLENLNLDIDGNPRFKNSGCNVGFINICLYDMIYLIYININIFLNIYVSIYLYIYVRLFIYMYISIICVSEHIPTTDQTNLSLGFTVERFLEQGITNVYSVVKM